MVQAGQWYLHYARMQQFGAFSNRTVGPFEPGLNVVYGSNEAGKTTFASFVEGVAFGWPNARSARNTYKPEAGERAGWLQFDGASEARLSRAKNADGLQGDVELLEDIDRETYRRMFWLTSDELRSLRNTTDVTARLLTAGSGTTSSPALALEQVRGQLSALTSRAGSETESLVNLRAEMDKARTAMTHAQECEDLLREESKEYAALEPERAQLSERMDNLSYQIERLSASQAHISHLEQQIEEEQQQLLDLKRQEQRLRNDNAALTSLATATQGNMPSPDSLTGSSERKIRDTLDSLAAEEAKIEHAIDMARDNCTNSKAFYEALVESEQADHSKHYRRQSLVQITLAVLVPLVFLLAGVPLFVHGRSISSLSFSALGAGLVAIAVIIAFGALIVLFRPNKRDEEAQSRLQDAQWVMLQDSKKLEASQQTQASFKQQVAATLQQMELGDAGDSIRQARLLLDQALDTRNDLQSYRQRQQALVSKRSELEASLAAHQAECATEYDKAELAAHQERTLTEVKLLQEQKIAQRQALRETSEKISHRCGELEQKLAAGRSTHTFDEAKLNYHQIKTRYDESSINYVRLLLARRMIEEAIAAWESKSQPEVYKHASHLLSIITDGVWVKVQMTESGQLQVENNVHEQRTPELLSLGTCQQLYLALRIALLIAAENVGRNLPVVADDILVNFDNTRRKGAVRAIMELAKHRQVIMLTCHEEIVETVQDIASGVNVVRL